MSTPFAAPLSQCPRSLVVVGLTTLLFVATICCCCHHNGVGSWISWVVVLVWWSSFSWWWWLQSWLLLWSWWMISETAEWKTKSIKNKTAGTPCCSCCLLCGPHGPHSLVLPKSGLVWFLYFLVKLETKLLVWFNTLPKLEPEPLWTVPTGSVHIWTGFRHETTGPLAFNLARAAPTSIDVVCIVMRWIVREWLWI